MGKKKEKRKRETKSVAKADSLKCKEDKAGGMGKLRIALLGDWN